ncbi:MAG: antitoxin VbhA family protein [Clostridiales bacterium]|nr:antitoxin VbhA family protein [Clostridiales bacterium]
MTVDREQAWNYALGLIRVDGLRPSEDFLLLVEREKRGEITTGEMLELLNQKYVQLPPERKR